MVFVIVLNGCGQRTGYEIFRQMGYQECLKNSPRPAEDCRYSPDFDKYQQLRKERYPE
ncbi:hypothetical protein [Geopsychrobacter electrodiphilus]|uniref:hypothetical protein n=1 Tax=Geopsychrobacter electrodiphilus TaxID=225196 RepID=UPI0012EB3BE1|nr:hypothetical protein [Geopsychrobacter electrodiphilus]